MNLAGNSENKAKLIDNENPENIDMEEDIASIETQTTYTKNVNNTTYYTVVLGLFTC